LKFGPLSAKNRFPESIFRVSVLTPEDLRKC
jgi:hypothetical protein